ncbi:hypothetical protein NDU88_001760 [Pleurodeles waltl]|uniref:Uncharacterized protein n=1 Tax=Pleurodeles waltl TaxID=8319 RepID=A0AAV7QB17_PLEWA|nr:hypothetical protein NDU88_001760 [Pleurodeles waltl]
MRRRLDPNKKQAHSSIPHERTRSESYKQDQCHHESSFQASILCRRMLCPLQAKWSECQGPAGTERDLNCFK